MVGNNREVNHALSIHYSQNYLVNAALIDRLLQQSNVHSNDEVLDIGAGKGIITKALLNRGCRVTAVELDKENILYLKKQFGNEKRFALLCGDFMELPLPERSYKVFSNIPFFITSAILNKITQAKNPPLDTYLILQKQAAIKYDKGTFRLSHSSFHCPLHHHLAQSQHSAESVISADFAYLPILLPDIWYSWF